jgi:hypothetical protein
VRKASQKLPNNSGKIEGHDECSLSYSNTEFQSDCLIPISSDEIDLVLSRLKK